MSFSITVWLSKADKQNVIMWNFFLHISKLKLFQRDKGAKSRENIDTPDNETFFFPFGLPATRSWSKFTIRTRLPSAIKRRWLRSYWHSVFNLANRWYRDEDLNHFCVSSPPGHPLWCATDRDHRQCLAKYLSQVNHIVIYLLLWQFSIMHSHIKKANYNNICN